ncbi:M15 family metallopeptidase [Alkalithermobacter paradoxus]|uniref:D-alanyl-D-alanine carboxypeptidase n=1 Tax=Alkalithermobacter paradoxus TaxID=29349 RepID=A0A1V4I690_9FIRM|nr:D-alanyl-D-alanine carboxypeptidase [[Clostridium] thermoalcaliphilum]
MKRVIYIMIFMLLSMTILRYQSTETLHYTVEASLDNIDVIEDEKTVVKPKKLESITIVEDIKPHYVQGVIIVNKGYGLPSNYAPGENANARAAFNKMQSDAKLEGITLHAFSTYRSYDRQRMIYSNYVSKYGQARADKFSARPGHSEHQTGLAFDIGGADTTVWLSQKFGKSPEGKWLVENAHKYGFVLRYPQGKEHITGYMYEPWHFRYVGVEWSTKIVESGLTLDEYFGVVSPSYK